MIPEAVRRNLDVSRETLERLNTLSELLVKWNSKINLVSPSTIDDLWTRHILDSTQIFEMVEPTGGKWLDIGSGGGFPGLVLSILNMELDKPWEITMMESDIRKCTFLRTVLRETGANAKVVTARIEKAEPHQADVVSARALADLSNLFEFTERHMLSNGQAIFPKGVNWKKELQAAEKTWSFSSEVIKSNTQEGAVILKVRDITRV